MKKLTLAAAIAMIAASGTTTAATIYKGKGLSYTVKGDIQVQLIQDAGDDEDLDIEYDDAELKNSIKYDVGNGMTAFAQVDFDFKKQGGDGNGKTEEIYVGLDFGGVKVWMGETDYVTDDFGVEKNIDVVDVEGDAFPEDASDDLIGVEFDAGPATIALSHDLDADDGEDEITSTDLMVSSKVGPVELGFAYQALTETDFSGATEVETDTDTIGVSASGKFGPVGLGLAYSSRDEEAADDEFEVVNFVVSTKVAKTTSLNLGYDIEDKIIDGEMDEVKAWYANVVYKFPVAKNVSAFAEIADTDEDETDAGFLVGMRVKF